MLAAGVPPATKLWQRRVDIAIMVDRYATRYGWDWEILERQPVWLLGLLPEVWDVKGELGGR